MEHHPFLRLDRQDTCIADLLVDEQPSAVLWHSYEIIKVILSFLHSLDVQSEPLKLLILQLSVVHQLFKLLFLLPFNNNLANLRLFTNRLRLLPLSHSRRRSREFGLGLWGVVLLVQVSDYWDIIVVQWVFIWVQFYFVVFYLDVFKFNLYFRLFGNYWFPLVLNVTLISNVLKNHGRKCDVLTFFGQIFPWRPRGPRAFLGNSEPCVSFNDFLLLY